MIIPCQLDKWEQISVTFETNHKISHSNSREKNQFDNVVCKTADILFRLRCGRSLLAWWLVCNPFVPGATPSLANKLGAKWVLSSTATDRDNTISWTTRQLNMDRHRQLSWHLVRFRHSPVNSLRTVVLQTWFSNTFRWTKYYIFWFMFGRFRESNWHNGSIWSRDALVANRKQKNRDIHHFQYMTSLRHNWLITWLIWYRCNKCQ